jgi:hypothetical protein
MTKRGLLIHKLCLISVLAAMLGCSSGGGGGGVGTGGSSGASGDSCDECLNLQCPNDYSTCMGNPECKAIVVCSMPCSDGECVDACGTQHPAGVTDFTAFFGCMKARCSSPCL